MTIRAERRIGPNNVIDSGFSNVTCPNGSTVEIEISNGVKIRMEDVTNSDSMRRLGNDLGGVITLDLPVRSNQTARFIGGLAGLSEIKIEPEREVISYTVSLERNREVGLDLYGEGEFVFRHTI